MPPRAAPSDASAVAAVDEASRYFTDGEREWYDSDRIHACETHLLERCATCGEDHGAHNEYWRRAQRERYMRAKTTRVATKAEKPRRVVVEVECPMFEDGQNAFFNVSVVAPLENLYAKVRERIAKTLERDRASVDRDMLSRLAQQYPMGREIADYSNHFYLSRTDSQTYNEEGHYVFTHILYRDETLLDCMPTEMAGRAKFDEWMNDESIEIPPYPRVTACLKSLVQHSFIIADAYESTLEQLREPSHSLSDELYWINPGDEFQRHFVGMCDLFNHPADDACFVVCDPSSYFILLKPTDTPEKLHLGDHTKVVLMNKAMMPMIERLQHTQEARVNLFPNRREAGGV